MGPCCYNYFSSFLPFSALYHQSLSLLSLGLPQSSAVISTLVCLYILLIVKSIVLCSLSSLPGFFLLCDLPISIYATYFTMFSPPRCHSISLFRFALLSLGLLGHSIVLIIFISISFRFFSSNLFIAIPMHKRPLVVLGFCIFLVLSLC